MSHMKDLAIDSLNKLRVEDEVRVEFVMRISHVMGQGVKGYREGQIFGFTNTGICVSAPLDSVKERIIK